MMLNVRGFLALLYIGNSEGSIWEKKGEKDK